MGSLFGFFCYATYDMTNQATLKNWPVAVTVVDIMCGAPCCPARRQPIGYLATRALHMMPLELEWELVTDRVMGGDLKRTA